ncbi:MAG: hypothetical protein V4657_09970 [Pseudomonadota bacterium]
MVTVRSQNIPTIALLSVAGDGSGGVETQIASARQDLAGGSLIEYQIATLARAGIHRFLIEVENVDGSLIALADNCRSRNQVVDFVRTGADIQRYMETGDRVWVQSGQLYVQLGLVETLLKSADTFVATVDGRDENAAFERIDLNTRWAGVSVVGADTIATLKDLPDDWSIISSLLRQAVLAKVPFRPMSQQHVNNGTLTVLTGAHDFSELSRQILRRRVASRSGFVETHLFGPILARLVPIIWQSPMAVTITKCASTVIALVAFGLAMSGFATAACVAAVAAVAGNSLRLAVTDDADGGNQVQLLSLVTWALLIFAMFGAVYLLSPYGDDGLFAAFAVASLGFLTQKMELPDWAKQVLNSPAALAIFAAIGSALIGLTSTLQWIMVFQLSALIVVRLRYDVSGKKTKQA